MKSKIKQIRVIGRREFVDFLQLNIKGTEAKIDTGAFSSAIHCENIKVIEQNGKKLSISFFCFFLDRRSRRAVRSRPRRRSPARAPCASAAPLSSAFLAGRR